MSDYMFMLESHLSADQFRVVGQDAASWPREAGINVFLTGGAIRDMLGGFPVRDLDFTVEGNALKLAKIAEKKFDAVIDRHRRSSQVGGDAFSRRRDGGTRHGAAGEVREVRRASRRFRPRRSMTICAPAISRSTRSASR